MNEKIIIIADTEEPGTFDCESEVAVIEISTAIVAEWKAAALTANSAWGNFSELRLFDAVATYYEWFVGNTFLDALGWMADADKAAKTTVPRITHEQVTTLRDNYQRNDWFVWPADIEFDLRTIVNLAAEVNGEETSDEEPDYLSVDVNEVCLDTDFFRTAALLGEQQVYSQPIEYNSLLEVA